jgi:hypothetical protein
MKNTENAVPINTEHELLSGQLLFLDDAGDPGFKFNRGSSRFLVISCVVFDDKATAAIASEKMREIKRGFGWSIHHEVKFHTLRKDKLRVFLSEMARLEFRIHAVIIDKSQVANRVLLTKRGYFYNFAIKEVLARMDCLEDAIVRLDGHSGRKYQQQAAAYFRKTVNAEKHRIADFKLVDSRKNELIQFADLVAGSIYHAKQEGRTDAGDYLALLRARIDDLWDFADG